MERSEALAQKYERLQEILRGYGSVAVAYSSGVDSTFLLQAAHDALGDRVVAMTTTAPWFPVRETEESKAFCESRGIRHIVAVLEDSRCIPEFSKNPPDRCYHCKKTLFQNMKRMAAELGFDVIAEGSNTDDDGDYRPGHAAIRELGICSPLREAGLSKEEIRHLSRQMGLSTWDKPSFACLASRFPYGEAITQQKLHMVEQAEDALLAQGFTQMRVRIHESVTGDLIGRVELPEEDIPRIMDPTLRTQTLRQLQSLGFTYVTLNLAGFQSGSLNRGLDPELLASHRR